MAALFTSQGGFTQQADAQGYHPTYIQTDYEGGTYKLSGASFEYTAKAGSFNGAGPADGHLLVADAAALDKFKTLLRDAGL